MFKVWPVLLLLALSFVSAQSRSGWPDALRFGIIPVEGSADATERFTPLAAHLEEQLGVPIDFEVGSDYAAVIIAMTSDQLDLAWFGPDSYVRAHEQAGAEAFVVEDNADSGTSYEGVIIANAESGSLTRSTSPSLLPTPTRRAAIWSCRRTFSRRSACLRRTISAT